MPPFTRAVERARIGSWGLNRTPVNSHPKRRPMLREAGRPSGPWNIMPASFAARPSGREALAGRSSSARTDAAPRTTAAAECGRCGRSTRGGFQVIRDASKKPYTDFLEASPSPGVRSSSGPSRFSSALPGQISPV
jgi:hypothetical protein